MIATQLSRANKSARRALVILQALVLATGAVLPFVLSTSASAAQLTNRSVSSTTAVPSATTTLTFQFRLPSNGVIQAVQVEFCDAPLGTCATTNTPNIASAAYGSINANWTNATAFGTLSLINGYSGGTSNTIQVIRTQAASETQSGVLDRTISFTGIVNNAGVNKSYYPRIRLYTVNSGITSATATLHDGAVAQSTAQTLTINARVQEVLSFCIGSTTVDDATTSIVTDCSTATGSSVDLGVIGSGSVSVTPVPVTTGANGTAGDNKNAYAMIQTNAQNGATIQYKSVQETSSGKLKVVGAACSGTVTTDQCFNSSAAQATFTAGTEKFGMTIAGVNCASVGANYTCTFASGLTNLQPQTGYIGATYVNGTSATYGSSTGYKWDDTGTTNTIASSGSSATKVIANEALVLKFAATSSLTTPTGQYQTQADFIATPTF